MKKRQQGQGRPMGRRRQSDKASAPADVLAAGLRAGADTAVAYLTPA